MDIRTLLASYSGQVWLLAGPVLLFLLYLGHRALLPLPLPGIPYNPDSRNRLLGDLPGALAYEKKHGVLHHYFRDECQKRREPVMQFWIRPFSRPWVIVCDGREAQDAMARRLKDFDRSSVFGDLFRAHIPFAQVVYPTNADWKYQRRLVNETMLPKFLYGIASNRALEAVNNLIELWKEKTRLAAGCTIDVLTDVHASTADGIWKMVFGSDLETVKQQVAYLQQIDRIDLPSNRETEVAAIPARPNPPAADALNVLFRSSQISLQMGFHMHRLAIRFLPRLRNAKALRDRIVYQHLQASFERFQTDSASRDVRCVVDLVVQREIEAAKNENRKPMGPTITKRLHSETCDLLQAGGSTTGDSVLWGLKELSVHQDFQTKIRDYTKKLFPKDAANKTQAPVEGMVEPTNPYLEAFMYEVLRHHTILGGNFRVAVRNTQVLGYDIPKGTQVNFIVDGPSLTSSNMPIKESTRRTASQASNHESLRKWRLQEDLDIFRPERWLRTNAQGEVEFDVDSNPMQTFGEGPRACFGQKFALLEMRLIYSLISWHFELQPLHPSLLDFEAVEELSINVRNARVKLREIVQWTSPDR